MAPAGTISLLAISDLASTCHTEIGDTKRDGRAAAIVLADREI
jgi:hypothetical protein